LESRQIIERVNNELFIEIASYRDPQLGPTVWDLVLKAEKPERLRIGICLQLNPEDHETCGTGCLPSGNELRGAQLRVDLQDARESGGVCWARAKTQALWENEPFTLQIDSHMRFIHSWDEELLRGWQRCRDERALLTTYPNRFDLPDLYDREHIPRMAALHFDEHGVLRLQGINERYDPQETEKSPSPSAFIAAGMLFGPSGMIEAAPYDPNLYFYGEEISLALRLWRHGFNFYNPDKPLIFHLYKQAGEKHRTHWADHENWHRHNRRSVERVLAVMKGETVEPPFGMGNQRTLREWQAWSGIDLVEQAISPEAAAGRFTRWE
jgi:hypothetical protein